MTKRTIDMIIRIGIELAEWISIILKEKRRQKSDDSKSKKKRESGETSGHSGK